MFKYTKFTAYSNLISFVEHEIEEDFNKNAKEIPKAFLQNDILDTQIILFLLFLKYKEFFEIYSTSGAGTHCEFLPGSLYDYGARFYDPQIEMECSGSVT
jgi:hypothetical protein